jgi:hypothetical protein
MSRRRRLIGLLGALCLTTAAAGGPSAFAADAAPAKPAGQAAAGGGAVKPKGSPLAPAIAELQKEFQAYAKDPKNGKLREKSDYFGKQNAPSAEVTPEVVLKALEGAVGGGAAAEAYVKWQLLSAVQGKFPEDLLKRAVAVYRRAPAPSAGDHPGSNRRGLNRAVQGMKKDQMGGVQKEFDQAFDQFKGQSELFLTYRDELYARLPNKLEALSAGLEDVALRASCGLNANDIFDTVASGIRTWAITDAKAGQVGGMIGTVNRLKEVGRGEGRPVNKVVEEHGMLRWKAEGGGVESKKIEELVKFLENNASGGGLKFKE